MLPERAANGTLLLDLNKFCFDDDSEAPNNKFNFTTPSGAGSSRRFSQHPAGSGRIVVSLWSLYHSKDTGEAGPARMVLLLRCREKFAKQPPLRGPVTERLNSGCVFPGALLFYPGFSIVHYAELCWGAQDFAWLVFAFGFASSCRHGSALCTQAPLLFKCLPLQ